MSNYKEIKTRQQFDSIPFHVADQSGEDLLFFQIPPLTDFIDKISKDELVLDIGCGTGRTTLYMLNKGSPKNNFNFHKEIIIPCLCFSTFS